MSIMKLNVDAIIFDMDGVITNTMPDHYRCWKLAMKGEGIDVTYEDIYKREGQPGLFSVREIFKDHGKVFNSKKADRILRGKENLFKKIVKTRYITGARNFIKHLHRSKFRLGLVTGTSRHELYRILPESLQSLFSVIVTGTDVKQGKPHPEPYLMSLKHLQIDPNDAVVIENAPFGIQSAKRAGITCLALETSLPKKYLSQADAVFDSIKDLRAKVAFLK